MVIFAALVLTILSFAAVAVPLYRNRDNSERSWSYEFEDITAGNGKSRTMEKQLENDYRTGILSEEDYRSQQSSLQLLVPGVSSPAGIEDEIEKRVAGLRSVEKSVVSDDIEAKVRLLRQSTTNAASQPATGASRQKKARFCQQCGSRVQPGARFCVKCGEEL